MQIQNIITDLKNHKDLIKLGEKDDSGSDSSPDKDEMLLLLR